MVPYDARQAAEPEGDAARPADLVDHPVGGDHDQPRARRDALLAKPRRGGRVGIADALLVAAQAPHLTVLVDQQRKPRAREDDRTVRLDAADGGVHAVVAAPRPPRVEEFARQVAQPPEDAGGRGPRLLDHDPLQGRDREHGHEPSRHAVPRAVHDRERGSRRTPMHPPDIAAHVVARAPRHGEVVERLIRRLDIGQERALDARRVADAFHGGLVRGAQLADPGDLHVEHGVVGPDHLADLVGGAHGHALGLALGLEPVDGAR